jgi:hypothetical protein
MRLDLHLIYTTVYTLAAAVATKYGGRPGPARFAPDVRLISGPPNIDLRLNSHLWPRYRRGRDHAGPALAYQKT